MARRSTSSRALSEDAAFLEAYDPSAYERPSVAVDVVLLTVDRGALCTLVVRRDQPPFEGRFALPGGFVRLDEPLEAAAGRVLRTKCALEAVFLEQLATFGDPSRDPRTRVISVVYYALVDAARFDASTRAGKGAVVGRVSVAWEGEAGGPAELRDAHGARLPLAFDHEDIVGMAVKRLRGKLGYTPIGYQLLGDRFTLLELQGVHETILGRALNKHSFRRRMLASGDLAPTGQVQAGVDHRPAELYRLLRRSAV